METSATFLENECYNKYGKTGKSFYYSQVASTVRWLSTTTSAELTNRLGTIVCSPSESGPSKPEAPATTYPTADHCHGGNNSKDFQSSVRLETTMCTSQMESSSSSSVKLPTISSFSEFINSRKVNDKQSRSSHRQSSDGVKKSLEKRMKLQ